MKLLRNNSAVRIRPALKINKGWPDFTAFAGVFFLLLIFFLLGSSFVQVSGIAVDLPQAHSSSSSFGMDKRVVTIDRYGQMFYNDLAISGLDILKERLLEGTSSSALSAGAAPAIIVRADSGASFGIVAKVMALAEELKLNVFVLTVPPATKEDFREREK